MMIVNTDSVMMWMEAVVAYFKIVLLYISRETADGLKTLYPACGPTLKLWPFK
jgi:hypothetical protein